MAAVQSNSWGVLHLNPCAGVVDPGESVCVCVCLEFNCFVYVHIVSQYMHLPHVSFAFKGYHVLGCLVLHIYRYVQSVYLHIGTPRIYAHLGSKGFLAFCDDSSGPGGVHFMY